MSLEKIEFLSIGRSTQYPQALLIHFNARPNDKQMQDIRDCLSDIDAFINQQKYISKASYIIIQLQEKLARANSELMVSNLSLARLSAMPLWRLILKLICGRSKTYFTRLWGVLRNATL